MSDAYFQERARRRTRLLLVAGAVAVLAVLVVAVYWTLFHDACTGSFDRAPRSVISTYLEAVARGDVLKAQECWEHESYYDLEAGCSEICLSKVYGAQFETADIVLDEPRTTPEGRANMEATVSIACSTDGMAHTASIVLDSVGSDLPWKHWTIVRSSFGGSVVEPWCK
jgi:hypothetical protein